MQNANCFPPNRNLDFHLGTDAAAGDDTYSGGFGAVLTQIWADNLEHVIAYASKSLKQNELKIENRAFGKILFC